MKIDIKLSPNRNKNEIDINISSIENNNIEDMRCAPGKQFKNGSCLTLEGLIKLANAYNMEYKNADKQIKLYNNYEMANPQKYKHYLLSQFRHKVNKCDNQKCWLKQNYINHLNSDEKEDIVNNTLRPDGPEGQFEWLNTLHIDDVMRQYEYCYDDFKFLGAVPIDFDDIDVGIKDLNFNNLRNKGIHKLGVVFNLDEHYKSGSHWVGLYADIKIGHIYFFDSYGIIPEERIRKFVRRIVRYCENIGLQPIYKYNHVRHQYEGSECGVYSLNFIISLLEGGDFDTITKNKTPDRVINKYRLVYFNNPDF